MKRDRDPGPISKQSMSRVRCLIGLVRIVLTVMIAGTIVLRASDAPFNNSFKSNSQQGTPTTVSGLPSQQGTAITVSGLPSQQGTPTTVSGLPSQQGTPTTVSGLPSQQGTPTTVSGPSGHSTPTVSQTQPSSESPYGFTVYEDVDSQTIAYLKQLGVTWLRYQLRWADIEPQPGKYDWSKIDEAIALANANDIHITFPIQDAPSWALTQVCEGTHFLPGPNVMEQFATALAQRYNGKNQHGYIDSYEVGNEEFDNAWFGSWASCTPCRQPSYYGPVLKVAYQAIKAQSPNALVGMFGLWWVNTSHIGSYLQWLYQHGYGSYFDFANYHYYTCNGDPAVTLGDRPSFNLEWQTIHAVMAQYGDANKPIWMTETGWNTTGVSQRPECIVSPQLQAQYMSYVLNSAANSHVIQHLFWYTIAPPGDGMNIIQPAGPLPSFYTFQSFVRQRPQWN